MGRPVNEGENGVINHVIPKTENLAEVVTIYDRNFRNVVSTLRTIATEIEQGKYGAVDEAALVIVGNKLEVFGFGNGFSGDSAHLLLSAGAQKLSQAVLDFEFIPPPEPTVA